MASPTVQLNDVTVALNGFVAFTDLFSAADGGEPITSYTVSDFRGGPATGYFEKDGVALGSNFTVDAADVGSVRFVAATNVSFEGFKIVARDRIGNFSDPYVRGRIYTVRPNTSTPHVLAPNFDLLANEELVGSNFISGFDPDGYPLTHFQITEGSKVLSATASNDVLQIVSNDHRFEDGDIVTIGGANESGFNVTGAISVFNEHVFMMSVPGLSGAATGNIIASSNDDSHFVYRGIRMNPGQPFIVSREHIDDLRYVAVGETDAENFYLSGFDGVDWSFDKKGYAGTLVNANRPVVQLTTATVHAGQVLALGHAPEVLDADGSSMKKFRFFNTSPHPEKGDIYRNGVAQNRNFWVEANADELDSITFKTDLAFDQQQIRVMSYDGLRWSAPGTLVINSLEPIVRASVDAVPLIYVTEQRTNVPLPSLFTKTDTGTAHEMVQFYDDTVDPASGNFRDGVTPLAAGVIHERTEAGFQSFINFYSGEFYSRQLDTVYVRKANDNGIWSGWERLDIRTEPEVDDVLTSGTSWNGLLPINSAGKLQISYSFMQQFPTYETGEAKDGDFPEHFSIFTEQQRSNARMMFRGVEEFANVQFVEVSDTSTNVFGGTGGIIRMGEYGEDDSTAGAFAFFPAFTDSAGDMWFNRLNFGGPVNLAFTKGSWGWKVFLHELGHALGLKHPHSGTPRLPPETDVNDFSVMSYVQAQNGEPTTYQLYDMKEIQRLYGANMDTRTGDDVYSIWNHWDGNNQVVETIWDAGGNDTLSGVGSAGNTVIDLRPGLQSSIGDFPQNITIAFGVEIENGIGAFADDMLIGNALDNVLVGLSGNDHLMGRSGNDYLLGGTGDDTYEWGLGDDDDVINEEESGGRDTIRLSSFPTLDSLPEDVYFTMEGTHMYVNLALENGEMDNRLRITNQEFGGSRIETLELGGTRIDLAHLTSQINPLDADGKNHFQLLDSSTVFGRMVEYIG